MRIYELEEKQACWIRREIAVQTWGSGLLNDVWTVQMAHSSGALLRLDTQNTTTRATERGLAVQTPPNTAARSCLDGSSDTKQAAEPYLVFHPRRFRNGFCRMLCPGSANILWSLSEAEGSALKAARDGVARRPGLSSLLVLTLLR
jgi:hypothetical protein